MTDLSPRIAGPQDAKGRLVSIFVGAVLLPSVALSVVSFFAVPKQAEATRITLEKRAEVLLSYVEEDLEHAARRRAHEAVLAVGAERLLDGRADVIRAALKPVGMQDAFETLHLEVSSPLARVSPGVTDIHRDVEALKEAAPILEIPAGSDEDALPLMGSDVKITGILRFRYTCQYSHGRLIREYFEKDFSNPEQAMVVRVSEPGGELLYENAPTPQGNFEVRRVMTSPSFRGLGLALRYKDRSIADEVHRWAIAKTVLIVFIDAMLGAGLLLVYRNVRREMHLSRLKSDFVANVSHELKTPLALIRLFSETLELGRVSGPEKAREYYHVINKESQRLTSLINNILDFSRIEAGRKEYRFARTDLGGIVDEVLEAYKFQVEQHGFVLEVHKAEGIPEVEVDREAISQALINLLNNAIKYSREEKHIRIELKRDRDRVLLSVTDRGIGIDKSEQKKIFEKFYRAEDSLVHETKGSGLGLALVRHIMEAHGGTVELESAPWKGSTFTLVLPLERPNIP